MFKKLWRKIVFWFGDVKFLKHFPWITWDVTEYCVKYDEVLESLKYIKPGDVGLHRWDGYLSNYLLPGSLTHAWIHSDYMKIVEATSNGVEEKSALEPMYCDYFIILRPKGLKQLDINNAVKRAKKLSQLEIQYDVDFKFELKEEYDLFKLDSDNVFDVDHNCMKDKALSCSETVALCYFDCLRQLNIHRKKKLGKLIIEPMDFFNDHFEIVWMSSTITKDNIKKFKFSEEQILMVEDYWRNKK